LLRSHRTLTCNDTRRGGERLFLRTKRRGTSTLYLSLPKEHRDRWPGKPRTVKKTAGGRRKAESREQEPARHSIVSEKKRGTNEYSPELPFYSRASSLLICQYWQEILAWRCFCKTNESLPKRHRDGAPRKSTGTDDGLPCLG